MADVLLGDEGETPQKSLKRKRQLRRLNKNDEPAEGNIRKRYCRHLEKHKMHKIQRCSKRIFITCSLIAIMVAIFIGNYFGNHNVGDFVRNAVSSYWRNYHQIVHGKNYCDEEFNVHELSEHIRREQKILHQNEALLQLQSAFKYGRNLISIALVGPVGVGKTLYTNALRKSFPWPQNIQSYVWNTFVRKETEKYRSIYMRLENFSNCGVNLFIIRNLKPLDRQLIEKITELIQHDHNLRQKRIILLFIFNLNTMLSDDEYATQLETLQNLKYTTSINFKSFGKEELKDCIKRELKLENITVSNNVFEELLDTIDVRRSGCKNVKSKVLAFGYQTKLSEPKEE